MKEEVMQIPTIADIEAAGERIAGFIHRTPVMTCETINGILGCEVFFKCENFQKVGAFKYRGATNAVQMLNDAKAQNGVATHSSGNHGAALARAARERGIKAYIVMPSNSMKCKIDAVKGYGGEVVFCEPLLDARESGLDDVIAKTGATFVHPYDCFEVICGQGTCGLELMEQVEGLDVVMCPVGGGGLLSGTAIGVKAKGDGIKVIAGEPKNADDAQQSFMKGEIVPAQPNTIADGLRTSLGEMTFAVMQKYVDDVLCVSEEGIVEAMRLIWERMKIIVEPSSAVVLGVMLAHREVFKGKRVGLIITGGNVDLGQLPW